MPDSNPAIFVLFGITGDLAWRKLVPALYNLYRQKRLPKQFKLLGVGRADKEDDSLIEELKSGFKKARPNDSFDEKDWVEFAKTIQYMKVDFMDGASYTTLSNTLKQIEQSWNAQADRIFYMATPPALFGKIASLLGQAGLSSDRAHARLAVEKPIGRDLQSAQDLNRVLLENFEESQIFRIDHYLGKETVQNILAFRFANSIFEPIWNRNHIDHVVITVAEKIGIGHRADYYEHAGALRDMVQNHLMQLFCLVTMEPPISFEADEIRNKKADLLHAVRPISKNEVPQVAVRGQYDSGWVDGERVQAYRKEPDVMPGSNTETFVSLKLLVDNWRWQDVPFYLRTGKCLPETVSEISIRFREVPHQTFPVSATMARQPDRLIICIQPDEGIILKFYAKEPGPEMHLKPVNMHFCYKDEFQQPSAEAYETLLWDLMKNDQTLFMRADQVESAWRILMPVIEYWAANPPYDFPNYAAGTWGPNAADGLISNSGRYWLLPSKLESGRVRNCAKGITEAQSKPDKQETGAVTG